MAKKLTSSKAREILHDKSVHGQPLTDKQRRFFGAIAGGAKPYKAESGGWLDKYDAPIAQNGIEGTMGGLTDIGFNYNGAWGGPSMQMGGSLPGATGGMYARTGSVPRTINPAPENGPYAKKTKASAQNGMEMKYYQEGLDFKPKTISQDGGVYDVLKQRLPSDATRLAAPIIPLTEKEKAEAAKLAAEGQRKAAERDRQILKERKLRASTKGNINVPGSFNIAEKARLFPESVGGLGQVFDEYVNPMYAIGSMADALGEAVAAKDTKALAMAAALTAGVGALGFDPLGTAVKNKNVIKNIPNLLKSSHQRIPTGPTIEQRLADLIDPIEQYYQRNPRSTPRLNINEIREAVRQTQERIDLSRSRPQQQFLSREEMIRRANENTELIPAQLDVEGIRRRFREIDESMGSTPELPQSEIDRMQREVAEYEASAAREEGISNMFPPTQTTTGPKFGEKDFKFDKVSQPGENEMIDPKTGTRYVQTVEDYDTFSRGYYKIFDKDGYITLRTSLPKNDPVLNVDDISFFNSNEKEAVSQFNKVMSNLPARVNMGEISTSMYSQPLMNSQLSRWANNQPGRIELKDIRMSRLNPFIKSGDFVDQIAEQFPKIQKSYKTLSETTGQYLPEPVLKAYSPTQAEYIPITVERLNTEAGRRFVQEKGADAIRVFAPKFSVKKNWQNGGVAVDSDGYWNPDNWGKPVIIPSTDITMEGVDQPLIGISDTGDVQYMQPGEDYSFNGEYVTEYPVAQDGRKIEEQRLADSGQGASLDDVKKTHPKFYKWMTREGKKPTGVYGMLSVKDNDPSTYTKASVAYEKPKPQTKVPTLYVEDPNDPRLKAYQDSLYLTKAPMEAYKRSQFVNKLIDQGEFDKANKLLHKSYIVNHTSRKVLDRLTNYNKKEPKPIKGVEIGWGLSPIDDIGPTYKKPVQPVEYRKPQPKQEVVKKQEPITPIVERRQNVYEGTPVYSPGAGSGLGSALVGFADKQGKVTYIKPEDYERFAVPKYGKQYIEGIKKQRNGGVSVNMADQYPIEKLDQSLNFTNYNKPTKGGWLDKYK